MTSNAQAPDAIHHAPEAAALQLVSSLVQPDASADDDEPTLEEFAEHAESDMEVLTELHRRLLTSEGELRLVLQARDTAIVLRSLRRAVTMASTEQMALALKQKIEQARERRALHRRLLPPPPTTSPHPSHSATRTRAEEAFCRRLDTR